MDVLAHKPGALSGSRPLAQWRAAGRWTRAYDELWQSLQQRHGQQTGTRLMIEVLQLGRSSGYERLTHAIEQALALGTHDAAAVRYLFTAPQLEQQAATVETADTSLLRLVLPQTAAPHFKRPLPQMDDYDLLLSASSDCDAFAEPSELGGILEQSESQNRVPVEVFA